MWLIAADTMTCMSLLYSGLSARRGKGEAGATWSFQLMARVFENHIGSHEVKKRGEETRGPNGWSTYGRLCVLGEGSPMRSFRKEAKKGDH